MESRFPYPKRYANHPVMLMLLLLKRARRRGTELFGSEKHRLHMPHYGILALIEEFGPLSQKDVSVRLDMDASDLVGVIDKLEQEKYVERQRDLGDRRRYALAVTDAGCEFLKICDGRVEQIKDAMFAPLSQAERDEFERLLRKLAV